MPLNSEQKLQIKNIKASVKTVKDIVNMLIMPQSIRNAITSNLDMITNHVEKVEEIG